MQTNTNPGAIAHTPGPWKWNPKAPSNRLESDDGTIVAGVAMSSDGHPRIICRKGNAALIAQAPALLQAAEKSLRWLRGERDCVYDGASDNEGNVPHQEDRDTLDAIDRDIDELKAVIAACKGER
jgi:hypothetical protein